MQSKMKNLFVAMLAGGMMLLGQAPAQAAEAEAVTLSGYVGVVSNYVWRGVAQNGRAASVQGDMSLSFAAVEGLSVGTWIAAGVAGSNETDYYITYGGESGDLGYSFGVTLYSYDFANFNGNAATQMELFGGVEYADFSGTLYMIPSEDSTIGADETGNAVSLNWIELGYGTDLLGMDLGLTYGTGTYNNQWVNAGNALESSSIVTISMSKELKNEMTISFNSTSALTDGIENEFWMSMDTSF